MILPTYADTRAHLREVARARARQRARVLAVANHRRRPEQEGRRHWQRIDDQVLRVCDIFNSERNQHNITSMKI